MASNPKEEVTEALRLMSAGEDSGGERLLSLVYEELRSIARSSLQREPAGQSLDSAALVHEAYLRLGGEGDWEGRGHFIGAAARAMRRILVEHARKRQRRAALMERIPLGEDDGGVASFDTAPSAMLQLDAALDRLGKKSQRKHDVVMMRYFAGLSVADTATALGVSPATVKNDWSFARTWLYREIELGLSG